MGLRAAHHVLGGFCFGLALGVAGSWAWATQTYRISSYRADRIASGLAPRAVENQFQLGARAFF